jgi:hypothetical protein
MNHKNEGAAVEHRSHPRYPFEASVAYRILQKGDGFCSGTGRTVNLSTSGVLIESAVAPSVGAEIELTICWAPAPGWSATCVIAGRCVRAVDGCAAIQIHQQTLRYCPDDAPYGVVSQN